MTLRQIRQSPSKVMVDEFIWLARDTAHLNASTLAWRGELEFALFEQANIKSSLRSLTTTAKTE